MKNFIRISIIMVLVLMALTAKGQNENAFPENDKTLSPYFFVQSDDASIDALPLLKTSADVRIIGVIADVTVRQVYKNSGKKPLEAVYTFPASTRAAVYSMTMTIGKRLLKAEVQEKQKARETYEKAKKEGRSTSLLEQQRPNVFQMNVANIMPGDTIVIEMKYTELLIPDDGVYQFVYPTVVGPRYSNQKENKASADDKFVKSPYTKQGKEPFYNFDISVEIAAGMPISELYSPSHKVDIKYMTGNHDAEIKLDKGQEKSGNKDYILNFRLSGDKIQTGLLLSGNEKEKFFLLMLQPPKKVKKEEIPPREYIFVIDVSGSMNGYPLDISKAMIKQLLGSLSERDLFNVILFAGSSRFMNCQSVPATTENINEAIDLIDRERGGGGTELIPALQKVYNNPKASGYSRSVVILTDGFINVEKETFALIRSNLGKANAYAFGIGSSVNRYLIEGMARAGNGEPFFVNHPKYSDSVSAKFRKYISSPVLTDVKIEFNGFSAYDVQPENVPDVTEQRPIIIYGKWNGNPQGTIRVNGRMNEQELHVDIPIKLFAGDESNGALKYLWARNKVAELSDYLFVASDSSTIKAVTDIGLKYNLLTKYTSFVAVDYEIRNDGKEPVKVNQPLPLPEGVSDYAVGENLSASPLSPPSGAIGVGGYQSIQRNRVKSLSGISSGIFSGNKTEEIVVYDDTKKIESELQELKRLNEEFTKYLVYPPKALEKGIEGKVVLWLLIDKTGHIIYSELVEGQSGGLYNAALNALKQMNFQPDTHTDYNLFIWKKLDIDFELKSKSARINSILKDFGFDGAVQYFDDKLGKGHKIESGDTVTFKYSAVSSDCRQLENSRIFTEIVGGRDLNFAISKLLLGMMPGGKRHSKVSEAFFAPDRIEEIMQNDSKYNIEIEVIAVKNK